MLPQFNPSYAVSAEAMAAAHPSALGLFARDAANAAEQFSDTMVATAAHDAKVVETGDTSVVQLFSAPGP